MQGPLLTGQRREGGLSLAVGKYLPYIGHAISAEITNNNQLEDTHDWFGFPRTRKTMPSKPEGARANAREKRRSERSTRRRRARQPLLLLLAVIIHSRGAGKQHRERRRGRWDLSLPLDRRNANPARMYTYTEFTGI